MSAVTRNPARKTRANTAGAIGWGIEVRKTALEASSLEDVLTELGVVVGRYEVSTALAWDGRPGGEERDGRLPCYAIRYELRRPGRPLFRCGGHAGQWFATLHEAAVWALLGALAWTGALGQDGSP